MTQPLPEIRADVIVLGAGIVGVAAALHLQMRGRDVVLIDRRGAGEETSHGNAGLIERSSVIPYGFPRDLRTVLLYALNRSADVGSDWRFQPRILPWLWQFWRESAPESLKMAAADMLPLIERSVAEHELLMAEAGLLGQLRRTGWIEAFRSGKSLDQAAKNAAALEPYGLHFDILDGKALRQREPHTSDTLIGEIRQQFLTRAVSLKDMLTCSCDAAAVSFKGRPARSSRTGSNGRSAAGMAWSAPARLWSLSDHGPTRSSAPSATVFR